MIRRQHRHHASGRTRADQRGAQRHGRTGVTADRFGDEILLRNLRQLITDFRQLRFVGDNENVFSRDEWQDPIDGVLKKRPFPEQRQQLLGRPFATDRPKPFAASAGHDDDEPVFGIGFGFHWEIQMFL